MNTSSFTNDVRQYHSGTINENETDIESKSIFRICDALGMA